MLYFVWVAISGIIAWTIVSLVSRVEAILASVCVGGLSGCLLLVAPNFISEFSHESIRGTLTSFGIIFYGIGLMVSYILGGCLNYEMMNYVCLTISVFSLLMMSLVKESPVYLMSKDLEKKAAESIAFYRSTKQGSVIVQQEMESIRRTLNQQVDRAPAEEQMLKSGNRNPKKPLWLQFFKKSKSTRRGLAIVLILFSLSIFQGLIVVQVYSEPLFKEALPNMSANLTSILFALLNTISGFVAAYLLDVFGRRPVMIYPSLGTCFFCIALGTQIQFHWGPAWLKGLFVYAFCITATCGAGTVPYVMIPEMFLPEVRGVITMLVIEWGWLCNFFILFIFNPFIAVAGLGPVFYVFAFIGLVSAIFCKHYLPETKGLTVDAIQDILLVT
ncbi:facilitated trehalose transporter Tret1-like isoform X2 [Danaus plexippus]|uniref:facilitated trehalose transporter Tret1-like isoform X2 n=1 Tax=Danaus plexippus TaxID=13037 RepID=UPI002AB195D8|nr:facilitated trehalose transporter Tret1-like isoform X2 [Danaus plexippus]